MKFICIALASSMMTLAASEITIGQKLPELKGKFLTGRQTTLPGGVSGRVALLIMGFSYDSRFAVESWTKRFREDFDADPQVTVFEIPMIGGMARLGKWFIDGGMRRGTPRADHERVITVYGGTGPWKERLGVSVEEHAYLILLDQKGNIAWRHAGLFDRQVYAALFEYTRKLASGE